VGGRRSGRKLTPAVRPGGGRSALRDDLDVAQAVAAHEHPVAVLERAPLPPVAVDEHAVEAAVVEYPDAVGAADDQRMPAGDGGVAESPLGSRARAERG